MCKMSAWFFLCFSYYTMRVIQQYMFIFIFTKFMLFLAIAFNGPNLPGLNLWKFGKGCTDEQSAQLLKSLEPRFEKNHETVFGKKKPHQAKTKLLSYCSLISLFLSLVVYLFHIFHPLHTEES